MSLTWIKCSERMPPVGELVMVAYALHQDDDTSMPFDFMTYKGPAKGTGYPYYFVWNSRDDCATAEQISHWAELPERPK